MGGAFGFLFAWVGLAVLPFGKVCVSVFVHVHVCVCVCVCVRVCLCAYRHTHFEQSATAVFGLWFQRFQIAIIAGFYIGKHQM